MNACVHAHIRIHAHTRVVTTPHTHTHTRTHTHTPLRIHTTRIHPTHILTNIIINTQNLFLYAITTLMYVAHVLKINSMLQIGGPGDL